MRHCAVVLALCAVAHAVVGAPPVGRIAVFRGNGSEAAPVMITGPNGDIYVAGMTSSLGLATPGAAVQTPPTSNIYEYDPAAGRLRPVYPPLSGYTYRLAPDPNRPDTIYAASNFGMLVRSTDRGANWHILLDAMAPIQDVVVASADSRMLYVAVESTSPDSPPLLCSTDGGATWQPCGLLPYRETEFRFPIRQLTVDPRSPLRVYASGNHGAFASEDGGATWRRLAGTQGYVVADPFDPDVLYAGGEGGGPSLSSAVSRSRDGGATWEPMPVSLLPVVSGSFESRVFVDPFHQGTLYVSVDAYGGADIRINDLYRTDDAGASWTRILERAADELVVEPGSGTVYVASYFDIFRISPDGVVTEVAPGIVWTMTMTSGGKLFLASGWPPSVFVSRLSPSGEVRFTTYLGGTGGAIPNAIAVDPKGDVWVGGATGPFGFPCAASLPEGELARAGGFLAKISSSGDAILESTCLPEQSVVNAIAVDGAGSVYIAGSAGPGFPVTPGVFQSGFEQTSFPVLWPIARNAFVSKFLNDGRTLVYSTYLGDTEDWATTIAVDANGRAHVAGSRIWKLSSDGSNLEWSTYLPGYILAGALDSEGSFHIAGATMRADYFTTPGAFQKDPLPDESRFPNRRFQLFFRDAFITKLSRDGEILYSTLLSGENREEIRSIFINERGNAVVGGITESLKFPLSVPGDSRPGSPAGFVAEIDREGRSLPWAVFSPEREPYAVWAVAAGTNGEVYAAVDDGRGVRTNITRSHTGAPSDVGILRISPQLQ